MEDQDTFLSDCKELGIQINDVREAVWKLHRFPDPPDIPGLTPVSLLIKCPIPKSLYKVKPITITVNTNEGYKIKRLDSDVGNFALRKNNGGKRTYVCTYTDCSYTAVSRSATLAHIRKEHFYSVFLTCTCGFKTFSNDSFRRHCRKCQN